MMFLSKMKRLIHFVLRKLGYRIVRIVQEPRPSEGLAPFFELLKKFGFAPKHILDVGANRGNWTREAMKFFPEARYTLVEPQDRLKSHIADLLEGGQRFSGSTRGRATAREHCRLRLLRVTEGAHL